MTLQDLKRTTRYWYRIYIYIYNYLYIIIYCSTCWLRYSYILYRLQVCFSVRFFFRRTVCNAQLTQTVISSKKNMLAAASRFYRIESWYLDSTLPEANIAPENRPSQNRTHLPTPVFQVRTVSFRECILLIYTATFRGVFSWCYHPIRSHVDPECLHLWHKFPTYMVVSKDSKV